MKKLLLAVAAGLLLSSCSHKVMLNKQQTTVTYSDRLPAKVGIFIPAEISGQSFSASASGNNCEAHSYNMESLGSGLTDAIITGIETAAEQTVQITATPTAQSMKAQGLKIALIPRINNVNADVAASAAFLSSSLKGNFQASITMNVMNDEGKTIYSFTSNGSGFNTTTGTCGDGAEALQKAAEMALQQIADNIAQTLNSSHQIREAIK